MSDEKPNWLWQAGFDVGQLRVKELETENEQLRADLKQCAEALELASKDTVLVGGDGESALSCIDDEVPTKIAVAAKKALSLPSVQDALKGEK